MWADMSNEIDPVKYGVLWHKVERMEEEVAELRKDMKTLIGMAERSKGGMFMGMAVISAISSVIGYFSHWWGK
jgi:uncharacterized protein (UPF0335 family)